MVYQKRRKKTGHWETQERKAKKVQAHTRYTIEDGTRVPGCTTVLGILAKPALVPWANKLGLEGVDVKAFVDDKAQIGTLAHNFCTDWMIGVETDTSDYSENQIASAQNAVDSFQSWVSSNPIEETIFVEQALVSNKFRFGGTEDCYVKLGGRHVLADLKTGKGIYKEHEYQVAALWHLLVENGYPVEEARILNVPRGPGEHFQEHILTPAELEDGWITFLGCLVTYYGKSGRHAEALPAVQELSRILGSEGASC